DQPGSDDARSLTTLRRRLRRQALFGYDRSQVDSYVEELRSSILTLQDSLMRTADESEELRGRLGRARQELTFHTERAESVERELERARERAAEIERIAHHRAERIEQAAHTQAESILERVRGECDGVVSRAREEAHAATERADAQVA